MNRIRLLDRPTIEQIRAGEVIERPASIVKELVENALDAGAGSIRVAIVRGGIDEITVQDDGHGIASEDAEYAFRRHATSKIRSSGDLFALTTLGFRGEALASIAAVTHVELRSRTPEAVEGVRVRTEGGADVQVTPAGGPPGTTVTARHVFFNTPPRRAFLKSPAAESHQVHDALVGLALSHSDVHFRFRTDGREVFNAPRHPDLEGRARAVLGGDWTRGLIRLPAAHASLAEEGVGVTGIVCPPDRHRNTRTGQYFFVNARLVKSAPLSFALARGYGELLPAGRFPMGVLLLTLPADRVDVNVHPTKREVKFSHERHVLHAVVRTVRDSLDRALSFKEMPLSRTAPRAGPTDRGAPAGRAESVAVDASVPMPDPADYPRRGTPANGRRTSYTARAEAQLRTVAQPAVHDAPPPFTPVGGQAALWRRADGAEFRVVGQSHDLFVVVEVEGEVWIVDQHAAHERILYEQVLDSLRNTPAAVQPLLVPITFDLAPAAAGVLEDLQTFLERVGFDVRPFGGSSFQVQAAPAYVRPDDAPDLIRELADAAAEGRSDNSVEARQEDIAARIACKVKSIKAGQTLTQPAMHALVESLLACGSPFVCPHGRPTVVRLPVRQLEGQFDRR